MPKYLLNSFLAGFFTVTFSASPYAIAAGKQKQPANMSVLKTTFKDMKLTTATSYGDMLASLEKKHPKHAMLFRQLAKQFQGEKFPKIQVQEFKYKGKDAVKLITQVAGQQVLVEYLFAGNEMMKINGTLFTKKDTDSATRFSKKLMSIPAFAKAHSDYRSKVFATSTRPTYEQWKRLTKAQRAEYYMLYRQLLDSAKVVNGIKKFNVGSVEYKSFEQWVHEFITGTDAYAAPAAIGRQNTPTTVTTTERTAEVTDEKIKNLKKTIGYTEDEKGNPLEYFVDDSCIVAGYGRKWVGMSCPWNGAGGKDGKEFYEKYPINKECGGYGSGMIACNPIVYGFSDQGDPRKPHCIDTRIKSPPNSKNFNFATHADGPCETASPLNTAQDKMKFISNILDRGDLKDAKKKLRINEAGDLVTDDKALFEKIFKELQSPLDAYINSAEKICEETEKDSKTYKYKDDLKPPKGKTRPKADIAYQDKACEALMKRAIAVQGLLKFQPSAPAPVIAAPCDNWPADQVDVAGDKCMCKDKSATRDETGKRCIAAVAPTPTPAPPAPVTPSEAVTDPISTPVNQPADCGGYFSRMNPMASECSSTAGDWLITGGLLVLGACIFEWFGMCEDDKSKFEVPKPTDPIPACDPATGKCPGDKDDDVPDDVDPVDPNPPAASEGTTNTQSKPNITNIPPATR